MDKINTGTGLATTGSASASWSSLPITQLLDGQFIPDQLKTPQAKKWLKTIFTGAVTIVFGAWFLTHVSELTILASKTLLFTAYAILTIVLLKLSPKLVEYLYNTAEMALKRADIATTKFFDVEWLQKTKVVAKELFDAIRQKLVAVDATRIGFIRDAEDSKAEAEVLYKNVVDLTEEANAFDQEAEKLRQAGKKEKADEKERSALNSRGMASMRLSEAQAAEGLARFYIEGANEIARVMEVLKDNEFAAEMYVKLLTSTINITLKQLSATQRMNAATTGLAEIFQVKDREKFQIALESVRDRISYGLANMRSNIEYVKKNRIDIKGISKSKEELQAIVGKLNAGHMKKLDIKKMSSASYEILPEEKSKTGFNFLDN